MKSVIFSSLLASVFSIKCNWQTPSYKLDKDGAWIDLYIDWPGIELPGLTECGWLAANADKWACGSTKFEGSFTKTEKNWLTQAEYESSWSFESEVKGCVPKAVCEKLAGGSDSCQQATYSYQKWIPRTCNEAEDFNAITEDIDTTLTLSCCDDPNYCNADDTAMYESCTEVATFSSYISALNECWNDYKRTFMKELLCDNDMKPNRDILSWGQNCTEEDGSWSKSKRAELACRYRPTCAAEMRQTLTDFGECACKAAKDHEYTGEFIGTAMQNNWQRFCPKVELSCAADTGIVELLYKYWVVRYKFKVAAAKAVVEAKLDAIKAKIAEKLNIDPVTITITIDVSTSTTRRLLEGETGVDVAVASEDPNTKTFLESNLNSALATELGTTTGADVTYTSTDTEEGSEATTGSFEGSVNKLNVGIVSLITIIGVVNAIFN